MGAERAGLGLHCAATGSHFTLHLVDLPGYGRSSGFSAMTLQEMASGIGAGAAARHLAGLEPRRAGGKQDCASAPERVSGLVTVASSPCFSAMDEWPGIKPDVLAGFQQHS
jgi:pimeloyl-[acyl-carrier protein] methyl ester esterase